VTKPGIRLQSVAQLWGWPACARMAVLERSSSVILAGCHAAVEPVPALYSNIIRAPLTLAGCDLIEAFVGRCYTGVTAYLVAGIDAVGLRTRRRGNSHEKNAGDFAGLHFEAAGLQSRVSFCLLMLRFMSRRFAGALASPRMQRNQAQQAQHVKE